MGGGRFVVVLFFAQNLEFGSKTLDVSFGDS